MIRFAPSRKRANPEWHHIRLEAPQMAAREHERMKLTFGTLYMTAHMPVGMNLWMAPDDGGGADIYISPVSAPFADDLIRRYRARPCPLPSQPILLIAGHQYEAQSDAAAGSRPAAASARNDVSASYPHRAAGGTVGRFLRTLPYRPGRVAPLVRRFVRAWA